MANSLLDFVMSLVRDPDAAAQYAADPAQAIAGAHLTDVTSVDVNNLIPVVAESLSGAHPGAGGEAFGADPAGNVWASGAATAAFDAFADHVPESAGGNALAPDLSHPVIDTGSPVIDQPVQAGLDVLHDSGIAAEPAVHDTAVPFDAPAVDAGSGWTFGGLDGGLDGLDHHAVDDHPVGDHGPGFDLFT